MNEQWQELKETIIELRDNDGTATQQEVCKFLVNLMDLLEKQMSRSEIPNKWIPVNQPPKASGRYIVTRHFFDNDFVEMANFATDLHTVDKYDFPKHKAGWYNDDSEYGHYELDDIVAWISRPKPYTEGGKQHD